MTELLNPLLYSVATLNTVFGLLILIRGNKDLKNIIFGLIAVSSAMWCISIAGFYSEILPKISWPLISHFSALSIVISYLYFSIYFPSKYNLNKITKYSIPIIYMLVIYILSETNLFIESVSYNKYSINVNLYYIYGTILATIFSWGSFILFKKYKKESVLKIKKQILYILLGSVIPFSLAMIPDLFLPILGIFDYIWVGPLMTVFLVSITFFGIVKYHLFNIKVIATEALVILIIIAISSELFTSKSSTDVTIRISVLILISIASYLLIKSVKKEIESREKYKKLTNDLQIANKKLKEISQQKSEFVSIATHQLRSPVSAIRGYSSMILEGSFGKTTQKVSEAVDRIYQSSSNLSIIIEDFLNLSRIEQGRIKYEFEKYDVKKLLEDTINEIKSNVLKKGLKLDFDYQKHTNYESSIDAGKIKQVFSNIIDNAVKYTPEGFIKVSIEKKDKKILISFKDSGIGIGKDTIPKLFQKFSRDNDAHKTNIHGTGLGLYVVKEIINAHKGKVWVESQGEGKGSQFYVELKEN